MDKMFTFTIRYDNKDGFGEITFCAKSEQEARDLFDTWVKENPELNDCAIKTVEVVHNEDDAAEYGDAYGNPSEYHA